MKILAIAFMLGLLVPAGYLFMRERMRTRMATAADIARHTGVPVTGTVIADPSGELRIADQASAAADRFRTIGANLRFILGADGGTTAMVTSATEGEGKTYVAVNIAATLAAQGLRTLLVAMDMSNADMASALGIAPAPGLSEYLSGNTTASAILRRHVTPAGLDAIPAGTVPPNPGALIASPRLDTLMAEMSGNYDYIIIDGPATSGSSAAYSAARMAEATVYVCRQGVTQLSAIEETGSLADKFRNLTIVHNASSGNEA